MGNSDRGRRSGSSGVRWGYAVALVAVAVVALLAFVVIPACSGDGASGDGSDAVSESTQTDAEETADGSTEEDVGASAADTTYDLANPDLTTFSAMVAAGDVTSIRLIGDSITEGYLTDGYYYVADGSSGSPLVYDIGGEQHFEPTTEARDWANSFRSWALSHGVSSFVNAGVGGKKMSDLASDVDGWALEGADVIFVSLGTNDATYGSAEDYRAAAEEALPALQEHCRLLVVMSPITDLRDENHTYAIATPISEMSAALREVCEEHGIVYVDMQDAVSADNFNPDGLHPTTEGSEQIWESLRDQLGLSA